MVGLRDTIALPFAPRSGEKVAEGRMRGQPRQSSTMPDATISRARSLRLRSTQAERKLWLRLRDRRLCGHKFLRQVPVGPYVADFVCREAGLIVEVDGSGHAIRSIDAGRDRYLVEKGFSVLRFWNPEVSGQIDAVCETIAAALDGRLEPFERYLRAEVSPTTPHPAFGHLLPASGAKDRSSGRGARRR